MHMPTVYENIRKTYVKGHIMSHHCGKWEQNVQGR